MLQVVDEFDDAFSAFRQGWMGFNAEIGAGLTALLKMGGSHASSRVLKWKGRAP